MFTAHVLVEGLLIWNPNPWVLALRHALFVSAGLLLAFSLVAQPHVVPMVVASAAALVAAVAPVFAAQAGGGAWVWLSVPGSLLGAGAFAMAALLYRRAMGPLDDGGRKSLFWGLVGTAAVTLGYPALRLTPGGTALGAALSAVATLAVGAGIILQVLIQRQELRVLSDLAMTLNRTHEQKTAASEGLRHAMTLLGIQHGWVYLERPGARGYVLAATERLPQVLAYRDRELMRGECRCLQLLDTGQLRRPINLVECLRMERAGMGRTVHATVPLQTAGKVSGVMNLVLPPGRHFTARELDVLSSVGHLVGLALERGRLFDEVQQKEQARRALLERLITAEEDERRRIARELHDQAGQGLTAMILNLELARALASDGDGRLDATLGQLKGIAESTLEDIRRVIYDLRPSILDDLGLVAAMDWFVTTLVKPAGIRTRLEVEGVPNRLPPVVETTLFRLAQEALTNVLRHARATEVTVRLRGEGESVVLVVKDNGQGFLPEAVRGPTLRGGLGVHGMRERAALLGGGLHIRSSPGEGTEVEARIPLEGAGRDGEDEDPGG